MKNIIDNLYRRKVKFTIDNPDDEIQKIHLMNCFYEWEDLLYLRDVLPKNMTMVDIGANVGNHTLFFSKFMNFEKIFVIEPMKKTIEILSENLRINFCTNVDTMYLGVALANFEGSAPAFLPYGDNNLGAARLAPSENLNNPENKKYLLEESVKIVTGDSLFENEKIDFIKLDVELMEIMVLDGLKKTIAKNRPIIFIEVSLENLVSFQQWLINNKYKVAKSFGEREIFYNILIQPEESGINLSI